ncbi:MAG: ABC transporter ATP-binding protein [Candidatus Parcubacteria bacterium]|nr:ABC transporter ATP-binding protein [Candidatus Parcubacteria bacterium]
MKNNTLETLKIYWQHSWHYKWFFLLTITGVVLASILQVIVPLYFKNFFDVLSGGAPVAQAAEKLIAILVIIAILELAGWVCWRTVGFSVNYFTSRVMADLSNLCFAKLHLHSFSYFNNNFVGTLVKRVQWFVRAYENVSDRVIFDLTTLLVNIIFIVAVLFSRNIFLGTIVIVWLAVFLTVNYFFSRYKYKYDLARNEAQSESTGYLADTVTNNANVKLFNAYNREKEGFAIKQEKVRKLMAFSWNLGEFFSAIQGLFIVSLEIGIFYLAIKLWQKNLVTVGDFVLIQAYLINIFNRIWNFGRTIMRMFEGLSDAEEMTIILNTEPDIQDVAKAKNLAVNKGDIQFKEVGFNYHQTREVLKNFNLIIKPGERVAIIGPSGAGKTTIAKILLRMHELSGGKILIDGQNISQVTQESLWKNISLVPQDPILFHRPLLENIRYGQPKASKKDIMEAAKAANCNEFIESLPQGYDTYVGERGIKLSGGERQRVAIARAILHSAPILILDEATSSLDSESEKLIQDALDKLMKNKTVIVIAHRLSTIRKMDRIVVVDQGKIVEEGTHQGLITKQSGIYKKLWELQAGGFI